MKLKNRIFPMIVSNNLLESIGKKILIFKLQKGIKLKKEREITATTYAR